MKNALVIILSVSILSVALQDVITYVGFKIHQDYIAQNLCVNKEDIASACRGMCFLQDQMSESKDTDKNQALPVPGEKNPPLPDQSDSHRPLQHVSHDDDSTMRISDDNLIHSNYFARTFRPPKC